MLDFLSDILPIGPLTMLALFVGGWLGTVAAPGGWTGLLVGAALGATVGLWLDTTSNPSVTRLRRYAYGALILGAIALAVRHWLGK